MQFEAGWRERLWSGLDKPWDLIVIGGGITGAGILREAARAGLRVLLLERNDFGSGTSSASSKLVHGGLRYLASGDWHLTLESVRERQALMQAAPGLVEPLEFILPMYAHSKPGRLMMGAALGIYDLMARRRYSRYLKLGETDRAMPYLAAQSLRGAFAYADASTDDARLVFRVISEAVADGGWAANYICVDSLLQGNGRVCGVSVSDSVNGRQAEITARAVINATGPWTDTLRAQLQRDAQIRPLRGSHLLFEFARLPLGQAVTLFHPDDDRPLFAFPWQGVTLFGTTDLDHAGWPDKPPRMSADEATYLQRALDHYFPSLGLQCADAVSSYSGVRPVVGGGAADPSAESRETALYDDNGLLTVTGGKLTTFRVTAVQALKRLQTRLPALQKLDARAPILAAPVGAEQTGANTRLAGRFGPQAQRLQATFALHQRVPASVYCWAELRWSARFEAVETLADLMLRRTRLGLLLPAGGSDLLEAVGQICADELGWDATRWQRERADYLAHWDRAHSPPLGQQQTA